MDERTNEEWMADLRAGGDRQAQALEDLRGILVQRLFPSLLEKFSAGGAHIEAHVNSIIDKTIAQVNENLDSFEGQSGFILWMFKFGVRQTLFEFRRQRWQGVSADKGLADIPSKMYDMLERDEFMQYIHRVFKEELTENQRMALRAMIMVRMPKEEVAQRLGMERCDYFKMIHDARLRMKRRLEMDGWFSRGNKADG
jgi:RNA polymerase sigma-70 factor (ECF subfamily)